MLLEKISLLVGIASFSVGILGGFLIGGRRRGRLSGNAGVERSSVVTTRAETTPTPLRASLVASSSHVEPAESADEVSRLMLGLVDTIDEIELMKARASAAEKGSLSAIQDRLRNLVELSGGELIREPSWQLALQRAVKVEPPESGQTDVRYLQTLSTGLKHTGRIIRKQEVIISQPKP